MFAELTWEEFDVLSEMLISGMRSYERIRKDQSSLDAYYELYEIFRDVICAMDCFIDQMDETYI